MKIKLLVDDDILDINKKICQSVKQRSVCLDPGKMQSALGAAYYPGDYPFRYGGIAKVAGALCYFLIKAHAFMDGNKRTAALASMTLMDMNGFELVYPLNATNKKTGFSNIIEETATSSVSKEELIKWFDQHKRAQ